MIEAVLRGALAPLIRAVYRPEVRGLCHVPPHGPVILAANHRAEVDTGVIALYPEGTRSRDGRLHRGHTGVAALALSTGAKVIPVALSGTERVLPPGARVPRWAKVSVTFGEPLEFSRYGGQESPPAIRRSVTDEIMYALMELTGLEYVDQYHSRPDQNAA